LDEELRVSVSSAGQVRFIVAPKRFHHLFVSDWQSAFREAQTFCAPGLDRKRRNLTFNEVLGDVAPAVWASGVNQLFMRAFDP
jgi:hypothetical protein